MVGQVILLLRVMVFLGAVPWSLSRFLGGIRSFSFPPPLVLSGLGPPPGGG
jgi:hypothetical protein